MYLKVGSFKDNKGVDCCTVRTDTLKGRYLLSSTILTVEGNLLFLRAQNKLSIHTTYKRTLLIHVMDVVSRNVVLAYNLEEEIEETLDVFRRARSYTTAVIGEDNLSFNVGLRARK
jgi:hypothetical protein